MQTFLKIALFVLQVFNFELQGSDRLTDTLLLSLVRITLHAAHIAHVTEELITEAGGLLHGLLLLVWSGLLVIQVGILHLLRVSSGMVNRGRVPLIINGRSLYASYATFKCRSIASRYTSFIHIDIEKRCLNVVQARPINRGASDILLLMESGRQRTNPAERRLMVPRGLIRWYVLTIDTFLFILDLSIGFYSLFQSIRLL